MANKKLGTAAIELKLPTKKVKGEKKPKWQAKTGTRKNRRLWHRRRWSAFLPMFDFCYA